MGRLSDRRTARQERKRRYHATHRSHGSPGLDLDWAEAQLNRLGTTDELWCSYCCINEADHECSTERLKAVIDSVRDTHRSFVTKALEAKR